VADKDSAPEMVFIAVGKEGKEMIRPAEQLAKLVRQQGVRVGYQYLPEFDHANILHQALMDGFRWMGER
jgi:hypothetical protein